jgi:hypothetical protein
MSLTMRQSYPNSALADASIAYRLLFAYAFVCPESEQIAHIYRLIATGSKLFRCGRTIRPARSAGLRSVRRMPRRFPARVRQQAIGGLVLDIFGRNLIIAGLGQVLAAIGAALFALWLLRSVVVPG